MKVADVKGMLVATAIHTFEDDAQSALEAMGLSREIMCEICSRGLAQYYTATPFHPASAPGTFLYNELVRAKRELLVPLGWEAIEEGLCFTLNEELSIALVVSSGNRHAGDPTRNPSFKYPKGPTTEGAVVGNAEQLGLFDSYPSLREFKPVVTRRRVDFSAYKTWWLLHHVDLRKHEMRAELSLPTGMGDDGEISEWQSRIILEPIPFDDQPDASRSDTGPTGPDFEFEVRKKA